jgi:hypothetical protein
MVGGGGGALQTTTTPPSSTQHSCKDTYIPKHNNTKQSYNTCVHKITNVPVVYMALILNGFEAWNILLGALEGVGPENLDFFGP